MSLPAFASVRPLVRYVDEDVAVLEVDIRVREPLTGVGNGRGRGDGRLALHAEISNTAGFRDDVDFAPAWQGGAARMRLDVVQPERWWPAGLGEQAIYELNLGLTLDGELVDSLEASFGLTQIRMRPELGRAFQTAASRATTHRGRRIASDTQDVEPTPVWVNGREWCIHHIVPVDRPDESRMLPATGDSLLVVRDHYGDDALFAAADRAGILCVQCVPIEADGDPARLIVDEVDRLAAHPSLAGWYVGHLGSIADSIAADLQRLDPTHPVLPAVA